MNPPATKNLLPIVILFVFSNINLHAATIKGRVIDAGTKEQLIGATVFVSGTQQSTLTNLDGSFTIKNVAVGSCTVICQYLGYQKTEQSIAVSGNNDVLNIDFALAQEAHQIGEVEVKGESDKESDHFARKSEQNAENILNIMSAKTIQLLPDITIASVLQRVSGVSLERTSTGDARYAIIRGMDQRYNYTLVNGIKIPSPDNKFRYVPMDMFPADIVERLEVIKALTPSMEGDAIGGVMNLVMKDAPNQLTISANIGSGFSQLLSDRGYTNFDKSVVNSQSPSDVHGTPSVSPANGGYTVTPYDFTYKNFDYTKQKLPLNGILGFSIGNRFLRDKKLGVVFAGSYQNTYKGSNSTFFSPNSKPAVGNVYSPNSNMSNVEQFDDIYIRQYNTNQSRLGLHSKIDYTFSPSHKISLYNMFMELDETQYRHTIDTSLSVGRNGNGTGNTYILERSRIQNQSIYNATLQGDHKLFGHFKLNWSGVYSIAKSSTPDWSEYQTVQVVGFDIDHNSYTTPPVLNIPFYRIWTRNSDRDLAGYLNLSYKNKVFGQDVEITGGGLYRNKYRDNYYIEYDLVSKTSGGQPIVYDGHLTPDKFATVNQGGPDPALTYTASEIIFSYYIQGKILLMKRLEALGGVRVENTDQGWRTIADPQKVIGAYGDVPYRDILPSLHLKYIINDKQNLRFSYFSAINRPGFFEYVPFTVRSDNFDEQGNPYLKHATANNLDLRYEFFPKALDQILIGAFYKKITNPIETAVTPTGTSSSALIPFNFGIATNFGFEIAITKYFGNFGISGNYTYTNSSITTQKQLLYRDTVQSSPTYTQIIGTKVDQTRPLQGQSPHIANVSILYKNPKIGLDMQLALVYTGKKITFVSPYKDLDYWQREIYQLDFSIEKKVFKHFTIYCKATNLLNTPVIVDVIQPNVYQTGRFALAGQTDADRITVQKDYYGQNFIAGIRFKI